jgi:hypothetical protein
MMGDKSIQVKIKVEPMPDEDEEEIEEMTKQLASELDNEDDVKVNFATKKDIPEGARSGELAYAGELLMTFMAGGGAVAAFNTLNSWVKNRRRTLKVEKEGGKNGGTTVIDAKGLSKEELNKLIDWLKAD